MKLILKSLVVGALVGAAFSGCSSTQNQVEPAAKMQLSKPSEKVQGLINKFGLEIVDYNYTKSKLGKGTRKTAKAILVDARPAKKFAGGTIPSSINIPDTAYADYVGQLKDTPKDKEILVYCGGWKCAKSPKVAGMLKKDGFTNVKLYQAGEPEWKNINYRDVGLPVVKGAQAKNAAVIIDARPYKMFLKETIPGAVAIPDTEMDKYLGRFPVSKAEKVIAFCGGFHCAKSHKIAKKLVSLGYTDVSVFAAGMPAWKKAGLATTKSASKAAPKTDAPKAAAFSKNGAKIGADEGSIDGEWFNAFIQKGQIPSFIQLVDVRSAEEFKEGYIKGAINIEAEKLSGKDLVAKLPKGKTIVFNCSAGGRSIEAWQKAKDAGMDISEVFYFDANIDCKGNKCKIEVNEPLD